MTQISILLASERRRFNSPPSFSRAERALYFRMDSDLINAIRYLKTPENKVAYTLQMGYFKAKASFYMARHFRKPDIEYVKRLLNIDIEIDLSNYQRQALFYTTVISASDREAPGRISNPSPNLLTKADS